MSVEKIPNAAAHGNSNTKGGVNIKGGHGAQGSGHVVDSEGGFGALLSSLGVDDADATVATNAFAITPDDQMKANANSDGGALTAFTSLAQSVSPTATGASVADIVVASIQDALLPTGGAPSPEGGGLTVADALSSRVLTGVKQGFHSSGQTDLKQMSDATEPRSGGAKTGRFLKERGRTEGVSADMVVPTQSANVMYSSKSDMRLFGEKVEFRSQALAPAVVDVLPLDVGQQTEFRRDKAIFKVNSTTSGSDLGTASVTDAVSPSFSLESLSSDVGAGMAQGDQNPGTYWLSSDLKNAEMKLDGFGESSVEVSVSVHGSQTHVAFRTDDVQTRLAMEDANVALKDMLSKEGLDLAGVYVGTSGAGGDEAHDRRSRQDGRTAPLSNLAGKFPTGASDLVVTGIAGKLDVFV